LNSSDIQRSELVESVINLYKFKPFEDNIKNSIEKEKYVIKRPTYIDPDKFYSDAALIPKKDLPIKQ
jgi:hypothetical protein